MENGFLIISKNELVPWQ